MARDLPSYDAFPHPVYGVMDSVGLVFALGAAGGAAFHFARGLVRGGGLVAGVRGARAHAPRVAGTLGGYCVVFSAIEAAASCARGGRDTDIGAAAAAAATSGLDGMRRGGVPAAARYVLYCAAGLVVMAEIHRAMILQHGGKCLRQNQMNSDELALVIFRTSPKLDDGCRGVIRPPTRPLGLRMSPSSSPAQ